MQARFKNFLTCLRARRSCHKLLIGIGNKVKRLRQSAHLNVNYISWQGASDESIDAVCLAPLQIQSDAKARQLYFPKLLNSVPRV